MTTRGPQMQTPVNFLSETKLQDPPSKYKKSSSTYIRM